MVEEFELNSFVVKFKQLWKSGLNAHLDLDTSAGKAWVGLRLDLGDGLAAPRHQGAHEQKGKDSPSKERRRERRTLLRKTGTTENHVKTEYSDEQKTTEEVDELTNDKVKELTIDGDEPKSTEDVEEFIIDKVQELPRNSDEQNTTEKVEEVVDNTVENLSNHTNEQQATVEVEEETDVKELELVEKIETSETEDISNAADMEKTTVVEKEDQPANRSIETVIVYATAVLENSPDSQVTRSHIDSLSKIIDCKEHLQRNIEDFKFGKLSSWELGNKMFDHQIQVTLKVKTTQLWESPRGYLWRHLGTSTWTLQDGTSVSLIKIHQK